VRVDGEGPGHAAAQVAGEELDEARELLAVAADDEDLEALGPEEAVEIARDPAVVALLELLGLVVNAVLLEPAQPA
jgi:hypothetical protein